jgi:hypothetical protein
MKQIKDALRKIDHPVELEALSRAWIEITLERNDYNRSRSCIDLGISLAKMRAYIIQGKITVKDSPAGKRAKG